MTDCLSEKTQMTTDERFSQLQKNIYHINKLVFPLHFQARYNNLARNGLIEKMSKYMNHDNVSMECDLVTIGWLVIAFYVGQNERYGAPEKIIKHLYHVSHMDDVFVHEDLKLFHMALEIGTRIINGEGETDSFEQSEFNYGQHNALCNDFYITRQSESQSHQNNEALSDVQSLIRTIKFLKKDPQHTDRTTFTNSPLYKESTILAQLTPTGYSAARTILNRAINAVNPPWDIMDTDMDYKTKIKAFKDALCNLKNEVLAAYWSENCNADSTMTLANLALGLAQRVEKKTITQNDIDSFIKATDKYRTTATMNSKLNQLIYAGVVLIALICTATAIIASTGVIGTILATTAGLGVGIGAGRYTIWQKNKTMLTKVDCLTETAQLCI